MSQEPQHGPTPPEGDNATRVRQGVISGRVLIVLLVSVVLAVIVFVAASAFA